MNPDPDQQGVPDLPLTSRCRAAGRPPQVRKRPASSYSPCVRLAWLLAHRGQSNCTHR
jgi:hypothetical protein